MMLRWLLASFHLLGLDVGLGAVWIRARALKAPLDPQGLRRVFLADTAWGVAAVLWIGTGLWRLLAGTEKATAYYLQNHVFMTKMALLVLVLVLEVRPMMTLIGWRQRVGRGELPDTRGAPLLSRLSFVQAGLVFSWYSRRRPWHEGWGVEGRSGEFSFVGSKCSNYAS